MHFLSSIEIHLLKVTEIAPRLKRQRLSVRSKWGPVFFRRTENLEAILDYCLSVYFCWLSFHRTDILRILNFLNNFLNAFCEISKVADKFSIFLFVDSVFT